MLLKVSLTTTKPIIIRLQKNPLPRYIHLYLKSYCSQHGLIVVDNSTYEVRPLALGAGRAETGNGRTAHVIRRAPPPTAPGDDARPLRPRVRRPRGQPPHGKPGPASYTIEIALFLDEAAYKIFYPFLNYSEADLRDMLLAYINGVSVYRTCL